MSRATLTSLLFPLLLTCKACSDGPDPDAEPGARDSGTPADAGNGRDAGETRVDEPFDLWNPERLLEVEVELADADWQALSREGPERIYIESGCFSYEYTHFNGEVTIDGELVEDVDVRKKGMLGSLSMARPSLKIGFASGDTHRDRTFRGHKRLTLNNNRQDSTNVRQCLTYGLFRKAGLPAPRCSLARVTAQGQNLGVYTNVEPINKPFLLDTFGDDSGNLYEGMIGDFTDNRKVHFESKTNEREADRSDIDVVIAALEAGDDEVWDALDECVAMDEFLTYWAMEGLIGFDDGYTDNRNNFYLYHAPEDDRFHFIPWGADAAFQPWIGPATFNSVLSRRLYQVPAIRQMYKERMGRLLEEVFDEQELLAEAQRLVDVADLDRSILAAIESFVLGRRDVVRSFLDGDVDPEPATPLFDWELPAQCPPELPVTTGTFDIAWSDTLHPDPEAQFTTDITIDGEPISLAAEPEALVGPASPDGTVRIQLVGYDESMGRLHGIRFAVSAAEWRAGDVPFHGAVVDATLFAADAPGAPFHRIGLFGAGQLTLETSEMTNGSRIRGSWQARLRPGPAPTP